MASSLIRATELSSSASSVLRAGELIGEVAGDGALGRLAEDDGAVLVGEDGGVIGIGNAGGGAPGAVEPGRIGLDIGVDVASVQVASSAAALAQADHEDSMAAAIALRPRSASMAFISSLIMCMARKTSAQTPA